MIYFLSSFNSTKKSEMVLYCLTIAILLGVEFLNSPLGRINWRRHMKIGRAFTANKKQKSGYTIRYFRFDEAGIRRWVTNNAQNFCPWHPGFMELELGDMVPHDAVLAPPIDPTGIACIGLNYKGHAEECGADWTQFVAPTIFGRSLMSVNSPNGHVVIPEAFVFNGNTFNGGQVQFDYEVELAVVIGKPCANVSVGQALSYVYGYMVANDYSERVRQLKNGSSQWHAGKCMPRSFPVGPWLVTADEVGDPQNLQLQLSVNGEARQTDSTAEMIFSVAECISALSQTDILPPGFVISTGTPKGVITKAKPELITKPWLHNGDKVELWIGNNNGVDLGRQVQRCVSMDSGWQTHFESGERPYARGRDFHS